MAPTVLSLCPFPIGLVRWQAAVPMTTIVVKLTFNLDGDGQARLAPGQRPLTDDEPLGDKRGGLKLSSDFVPCKAHPELLLSGSAHSSVAGAALDVVIELGHLYRAVVVTSPSVEHRIPITPWNVREVDGAPTTLGPKPGFGTHAEVPHDILDNGSAAARFNSAVEAQALTADPGQHRLKLTGLTAGGGTRVVQLPGLRPALFLREQGGAARSLTITFDTLVIDADESCCSLVYRVSVPSADLDESALVLAAQIGTTSPTWTELEWQLRHVTVVKPEERRLEAESMVAQPDPSQAPPATETHAFDQTAGAELSPEDRPVVPFLPTHTRPRPLGGMLAALATPPAVVIHDDALAQSDTLELTLPVVGRSSLPFVDRALASQQVAPQREPERVLASVATLAAGAPMAQRSGAGSSPAVQARRLLGLAELVALGHVLEHASDPLLILRAAGLELRDWIRAHRFWLARAAHDPGAAREILALLDQSTWGSEGDSNGARRVLA